MTVNITIIIEGVAHKLLKWPHVPRVGDHIEINQLTKRIVVVVDVLWKDDCLIDLICEEVVQ